MMQQNLKQFFIFIVFNIIFTQAFAVTSVITLVKSNCWLDYSLHVEIQDRNTQKNLAELVLPKNQAWGRIQFDGESNQVVAIKASFSPPIFEADRGRFYLANRFWIMPTDAPSLGSIWTFDLCFDRDFANVPTSKYATGNCACDFSRIPAIVPRELPAK